MIAQELKKLTKNAPKDRDNEWENQVRIKKEKNCGEELEIKMEKEREEQQKNV